jgi:hypothetical protein
MKLYADPNNLPPEAELEQIIAILEQAYIAVKRFRISLSIEERRFRRKLGDRRLAYAILAARFGMLHEDAMPRSFNPKDFVELMKHRALLAPVLDYLFLLTESIDDTLMALGIDAMTFTKLVHDALKSRNGIDPSLDAAVQELDEFNFRAEQEDKETAVDTPSVTE